MTAPVTDRLATAKAHLADLVAFPVLPGGDTRALIGWAEQVLRAAGARVTRYPAPDGMRVNLLARLGPEGPGGVLLSGHSDVVPVAGQVWSGDPFKLREAGGRLIGRGACDMKGFLACCLAAAPDLGDAARPVAIALTFDEEIGCRGVPHLIAGLARDGLTPAAAIVGEPTGLKLVDGHKGCFEYTTRFTGRAGHGANPGQGGNAVEAAARFVAALGVLAAELAADAPDGPFDPPETTISVGRIEGGTARNVIAEHCTVEWEFRPATRADEAHVKKRLAEIEAAIRAEMQARHPEARVETEILGDAPGLVPDPASPATALARRITGETAAGCVSFSTEAGPYQAAGIPAVVCGPGDIAQAHTADEFIEARDLALCLAALARLPAALA